MSVMEQIDCHNHFLAIRTFGTHIEAHVIMHLIRNGHGRQEWDTTPSTMTSTQVILWRMQNGAKKDPCLPSCSDYSDSHDAIIR